MQYQDTITAISTPAGPAAIGIVRVSGPLAEPICGTLFRGTTAVASFESHRLYHGDLVSQQTGSVVDEVLVVLMRAPHSFTGEDILEIHCHGGPVIVQAILGETLRAGARLAGPGEFTERAFLNDRMDLAQAEAVMEMIAARTEEGLRQAVYQLKGNLSTEIRALRCPILDLLARIEASIDFPDEDTDFSQDGLAQGIQAVAGRIEALLSTAREGMLFREGLQAVIAGKANVGKSSLLNCLLGQERAIVTPIPGTTRDFIAECINIQGIPVNVTDTAGIRDTDDPIEKKGMALVWERLAKADVVILVLDGSEVPGEEDFRIIEKIRGKAVITVFNKKDLPKKVTRADEDGIRALLPETPFLSVSAKYGEGIESLKASLYRLAVGEKSGRDTQTVITSLRHKGALERALDLLLQAGKNIREGNPPELAAYDLREASGALGEIMGETTAEDVLERIFSTFCIGK